MTKLEEPPAPDHSPRRDRTTTARMSHRTRVGAGVLALVMATVISACSSSGSKSPKSSGPSTPASTGGSTGSTASGGGAAALVPANIKAKGTLVVGTEGDYPPESYVAADGKTLVGSDIDIANALGPLLGVKIKLVKADFTTLIPSIQDGRFDMAVSGAFVTAERLKVVDFVTYENTGESFYVKAGKPAKYTSPESLCGAKVAVLTGSVELTDAQTQAKKCKIDILSFSSQNDANLAVSSGRADVGFVDTLAAGSLVKQTNGQFVLSGKPINEIPQGIELPKGNGMAKAVQAALTELFKNGTYLKIFKKHDLQDQTIPTPQINPTPSR